VSPRIANFGDTVSCRADMSSRHADMLPTSCDIGLFFSVSVSCRHDIADMSLSKYRK